MKRVAAAPPATGRPAGLRWRYYSTPILILLLILLALLAIPPAARAQGMLGNPADLGEESGIGLVSGWHCDATLLEVQFDDYPPIEASYGTSRQDTLQTCGDDDNGFALLWNWNILGDGVHTVRVFADGVEFDSAVFEVNTLGAEFLRNLAPLQTELLALDIGKEVEITWQESKQNFVITRVEDADITMELVLQVLGGSWSGNWNAPGASGTLGMTIGDDGTGRVVVSNVTLTGTGCATQGTGIGAGIDLNDPLIDVEMTDGSLVEFEFLATESFTAVGGAFWFAEGPCADADGIYYMFKD